MSYRGTAIFGFLIMLALSVPAIAFDWSQFLVVGQGQSGCRPYGSCIVAGAEVDDEATIQARKKVGSGPAAGLASDRRVKSDIIEVGTLPNGIKLYAFRFIWEEKIRVGVIAQDLLERPDTKGAVLQLANGLLGVDYAALGLRMATEAQWVSAGLASVRADYKPETKRLAKLDEPVALYNRRPGQ